MVNYFWTILHNDDDYQKAMDRFSHLFGKELELNSDESDEFDLLAMLIEKYENLNYPIDEPSPIDYLKFIMDQKGLTNKDMVQYLGSMSKVSEVLNGKRNLSLNMIKKLHNELGIPADILLQDINCIDDKPDEVNEIDELIFATIINNDDLYTSLNQTNKNNTIPVLKNRVEKVMNTIKNYVGSSYINETDNCFYL